MSEPKKRSAAINTALGITLIIFSIYVIVSSMGMKYFRSFIDGAGFFPFIIGWVLLGLGVVLTFIGLNAGGIAELKEVFTDTFLKAFVKNDSTVRVAILLGMMVVYVFILLEAIPFVWATSIYLFATFLYLDAFKRKTAYLGWLLALVTSLATSFIVYYAFKIGLGLTIR